MNKDEFHRLQKGDIFTYLGVPHKVVELERFAAGPGRSETFSITDQHGNRAKEDDAIIKEFGAVPQTHRYIVHESNIIMGDTMRLWEAPDVDDLARRLVGWDTYDGDDGSRPWTMADLAKENDGEVVYTIYELRPDATLEKVL